MEAELNREKQQALQPLQGARDELRGVATQLHRQLQQIKDAPEFCPTCGQRLPDTGSSSLEKLQKEAEETDGRIAAIEANIEEVAGNWSHHYQEVMQEINQQLASSYQLREQARQECRQCREVYQASMDSQQQHATAAAQLRTQLESYQNSKHTLEHNIMLLTQEVEQQHEQELYNIAQGEQLKKRLATTTRINTLLVKDFRGVLLSSVVEYINRRAKEYSKKIFGTDSVSFTQDGNQLNVAYGGKIYETLSGGEKQRVDIIVQLSLRALLCQYAGFSANILVLDELFDGLDSMGCERVLDAISTELEDVESIYIITHHSDIDLPIDRFITVTKDCYGISSITQ